jgi:outer membrane receptor protein involved in Fe transport
VKLTAVNLELVYQQTEKLQVMLTADYRHFEMATEEKPWQTPAFIAKVNAKYLLNRKISFTGDLFYNSSIYAPSYENGVQIINKRDGFVDLNLGAEYRFTDRISVFARVNNVASVRYYRWYNYPSQRISAMGGLTFSF